MDFRVVNRILNEYFLMSYDEKSRLSDDQIEKIKYAEAAGIAEEIAFQAEIERRSTEIKLLKYRLNKLNAASDRMIASEEFQRQLGLYIPKYTRAVAKLCVRAIKVKQTLMYEYGVSYREVERMAS